MRALELDEIAEAQRREPRTCEPEVFWTVRPSPLRQTDLDAYTRRSDAARVTDAQLGWLYGREPVNRAERRRMERQARKMTPLDRIDQRAATLGVDIVPPSPWPILDVDVTP